MSKDDTSMIQTNMLLDFSKVMASDQNQLCQFTYSNYITENFTKNLRNLVNTKFLTTECST
jgi:hypothetical protein